MAVGADLAGGAIAVDEAEVVVGDALVIFTDVSGLAVGVRRATGRGDALAIETRRARGTIDAGAGIAGFAAVVDANLVDPAVLVGKAVADEIALAADADFGLTTVGVELAVAVGDALSVLAGLVGQAVGVGVALRSGDTLIVDAFLTDGAVKIVKALRRGVFAFSPGSTDLSRRAVGVDYAFRRDALIVDAVVIGGTVGGGEAVADEDALFFDALVLLRAVCIGDAVRGRKILADAVDTAAELSGTVVVAVALATGGKAGEVDAGEIGRTVGVVETVDGDTLIVDAGRRLAHDAGRTVVVGLTLLIGHAVAVLDATVVGGALEIVCALTGSDAYAVVADFSGFAVVVAVALIEDAASVAANLGGRTILVDRTLRNGLAASLATFEALRTVFVVVARFDFTADAGDAGRSVRAIVVDLTAVHQAGATATGQHQQQRQQESTHKKGNPWRKMAIEIKHDEKTGVERPVIGMSSTEIHAPRGRRHTMIRW